MNSPGSLVTTRCLLGRDGGIRKGLAANTELLDEIPVAFVVLSLQIVQQPTACADHLDETETRTVIFRVLLEMLR